MKNQFAKRRIAPLYFKGGGNEQKETEYEKAFAEVAQKKWKLYNEEYRPFVDKFISGVDEMQSPGNKQFVAGAASSATSAAFDESAKATERGLQKAGINPNSGAYKTTTSSLRDVQGKAAGENTTRALNELGDQHVKGLQNASAIGRGESASAQAGLSDIANLSAQKAREESIANFQDGQNLKRAASTGLGIAAGMYEKPDTTSAYEMADYQNYMSRGR